MLSRGQFYNPKRFIADMSDSKIRIVFPFLFIFWVFSSVAIASEAPGGLNTKAPLVVPEATQPLLMAQDTASQELPEESPSQITMDFESAFREYLKIPWSLMIYQGFATSTDLGQTLVFDIKSEDSQFTGLVVNRKMFPFWRYFTFELEGQVLRHYGKQELWEYNGLFMIRFHPFLLDSTVNIEFAAGEGLSYASELPVIEQDQHPDAASRFLNYLVFEIAVTLPQYREWTLATRIHHRSGVFGLFNGTRGGSNFLALGLRYHF